MARLNVDIRSNESPMDFQWQQGHGPADADSPFMKVTTTSQQQQNGLAGHKRPFNELQSPSKTSVPALREPASQTFLFPSTPSMKPPIQFRNPSFTTPQRPVDTDFSSGPENQSSPGNADNEDTPEPPSRSFISRPASALVHFMGSKSDHKQNPLGAFNHLHSSGRGEIPRKAYTDVITRRVQKRRRRDADKEVRLANRRPSYDSDSGSRSRPSSQEGLATPQQKPPPSKEVGLIPSVFSFIEKHPNLPHILSYYAQFLLNVFIVFFMMYLVYSFWSTIRSDVDIKSREVASETLAEMAACTREFRDNKCDRADRVPAMEIVCNNWEKCMQQDPTKVGRARVSAKTFAEILNSFMEPISIKAMVSSFILIFGCFAISNLTLSLFRNRISPPSPPSSQPSYRAVPPSHQIPYSGQAPGQHYYTPYQHQLLSEHDRQGFQTPVRRLGYR